jgi:hypothetical protein
MNSIKIFNENEMIRWRRPSRGAFDSSFSFLISSTGENAPTIITLQCRPNTAIVERRFLVDVDIHGSRLFLSVIVVDELSVSLPV